MRIVRERLDQTALDIEFLLISVVQGVALAALAQSAATIISSGQLQYWPYVLSAFLFIIIFWSQAIIHAVSFIDWPLDLWHNFLYFLASLVEVMSFSHMTDPKLWFAFVLGFITVAEILYIVDYRLIKQHRKKFSTSLALRELYNHIVSRQKFELTILVPGGILFNIIAVSLIILYPEVFLIRGYHLVLIGLQIIFDIVILTTSLSNFRTRSLLITQSALEKR